MVQAMLAAAVLGAWVGLLLNTVISRELGETRFSVSRHVAVYLLTVLLFAAMTWRFLPSLALLPFLYLVMISVVLGAIDLKVHRLPNWIVLPSYPLAFILLLTTPHQHYGWLLRALIAMVVCFALYLLLALVSPGSIGFGDVKLAGVLGLYLGWLGWHQVLVGMFLGFFLGAVFGIVLMLVKKVGSNSHIAFGPYMLAGALLAVYITDPLTSMFLHSV